MTADPPLVPGPDVTGAPVLEVSGVVKRFVGVTALNGVSVDFRPGEVHALVGENGAGKSTLIKVITGVYQSDGGEVRLDGSPASFRSPLHAQAAGISTIYQEINAVPLISVARNLFLGREPRNRFGLLDIRAMNVRAQQTLRTYELDIDVQRPMRSFGTGTQQMIAIARAMMLDARVVIMDEPTSSLEPREVATLFGVIDRLRGQGVAVVYVSHRLEELYQVCQRVTVLRDGGVVHSGAIGDVPRLRLVAMMLGRDVDDVRRSGRTRLDAGHVAGDELVLEAEHLRRRHAVDDVSLNARRGEVVGLAGLLGAGRTETLQALAGALPLDAGSVAIAGRRVRGGSTRAAIAAGIALLPEDRKADGIVPGLSVRDNIVLAALPRLSRAGVVSERRQNDVAADYIRRLRIKASGPNQRVGELSGGNQQKVLLARALCADPRVLLLDDPTRGIDVGAKADVQSLVSELSAQGMAVVLASSELEEVLEGADRVLVLRAGAVIGELSGDAIGEREVMELIAESTGL